MFVDMQLPIDLFNTASEFFTAIIQIVLIAVALLPALCAIPVMAILLFAVQHFYPRTCKQLRLHELETKAALLTSRPFGRTAGWRVTLIITCNQKVR